MLFVIYATSGVIAPKVELLVTRWNLTAANHGPNTSCLMVPPLGWDCE